MSSELINEDNVKIIGDIEIAKRVISALKEVYDPEIPVNIYDLGLIYEIHISKTQENTPYIKIVMTLTAMGCPVMGTLGFFVEEAIKDVIPDANVEVELTFDPPWTPERITKEGREQFKAMYGYDIVDQWIRIMRERGY
ncbi:MAG: iron-sulfur cluster assembly protein [Acidilobaceae archaeon]